MCLRGLRKRVHKSGQARWWTPQRDKGLCTKVRNVVWRLQFCWRPVGPSEGTGSGVTWGSPRGYQEGVATVQRGSGGLMPQKSGQCRRADLRAHRAWGPACSGLEVSTDGSSTWSISSEENVMLQITWLSLPAGNPGPPKHSILRKNQFLPSECIWEC